MLPSDQSFPKPGARHLQRSFLTTKSATNGLSTQELKGSQVPGTLPTDPLKGGSPSLKKNPRTLRGVYRSGDIVQEKETDVAGWSCRGVQLRGEREGVRRQATRSGRSFRGTGKLMASPAASAAGGHRKLYLCTARRCSENAIYAHCQREATVVVMLQKIL
jgi:hypothetical protein